MKASVVTQVIIDAKSSDVFEFLINLKYHYLWNPQLQSITPIMILKKGSTYEATSLLLGVKVHAKNVVTKLVKNKELEIENNTGILHYTMGFVLVSEPNRTVLNCSTVVSSDSDAFAFTTPVLKILARRELQADMQSLKLAIEQQLV